MPDDSFGPAGGDDAVGDRAYNDYDVGDGADDRAGDPPWVRARKRAGGLFIRSAFHGTAALVKRVPLANVDRHDVEVIRSVPYLQTGLIEHTYDVYRPKGRAEQPLPMVLYIHGGAFRALSKETHWIMGLALARRGLVVVVPNYRLAPKHRFPAGSADVVAALVHARAHAERYGADKDNVVIAGESAGANITMGLITGVHWGLPAPHLDPIRDVVIKAAVPFCGVFQVSDPGRFRRQEPTFNWFFNDRVHELPSWLPRRGGRIIEDPVASPLLYLEGGPTPTKKVPPLFIPVGGGDFLKDDHVRLKRALDPMGVHVELDVYGLEPHAFHAFVWRPEARRCWRDTADFLRRHGVPVREPPPVSWR
jgi:acetyl esterase